MWLSRLLACPASIRFLLVCIRNFLVRIEIKNATAKLNLVKLRIRQASTHVVHAYSSIEVCGVDSSSLKSIRNRVQIE